MAQTMLFVYKSTEAQFIFIVQLCDVNWNLFEDGILSQDSQCFLFKIWPTLPIFFLSPLWHIISAKVICAILEGF